MHLLLLAFLLLAQRPGATVEEPGAVSGRVLNPDGSAAARTRVSAMSVPQAPNEGSVLAAQTEAGQDGRYQLTGIPAGRYYIVAGLVDAPTYYPSGSTAVGATPVNVTARAAIANIDIRLEPAARAFTISGKIIDESGQTSASRQVSLDGGELEQRRFSRVMPDGSFEFTRVKPGSYELLVSPAFFLEPRSVVIRDKDITGVQLTIPWITEVISNIVVEDRSPVPSLDMTFVGRGVQTGAEKIYDKTSMRAMLAEGAYGVSVFGVPSGLYVKSIVSGTANLQTQPYRLSRTSPAPEIVVTLGVSTPAPWVKVSGRIPGWKPTVAVSGISLSSQLNVEVPIAADGTFEFSKVLPGTYMASLRRRDYIPPSQIRVIVPSQGLTGIELPFQLYKQITGRVAVEGGGPIPHVTLMVSETDTESKAALAPSSLLAQLFVIPVIASTAPMPYSLQLGPNGTFNVALPEGTFQISAAIPPLAAQPYAVKTFTYGSTNLQNGPVRIASNDSSELQLTLTSPQLASFKVSGRVVGLTVPRNNALVTLSGGPSNSPLQSRLSADDSFEFPNVYPGEYEARLSVMVGQSPAAAPVQVRVGSSDVTGLNLVVPPHRQVSGRVIVEGQGQITLLRIPLYAPNGRQYPSGLTAFVQPNGTFTATVELGEFQIGSPALPPGYTLKSMTYGSTDLTKGVLKVGANDTEQFVVTVSVAAQASVKVRGRISGLDADTLRRNTTQVYINSPTTGGRVTTVLNDGTFEISGVSPATYRVTLGGTLPGISSASTTITVGNADVDNVVVTVPPRREVRGRVTLEGRGKMPQLSLLLGNPSGHSFSTDIRPGPDGTFSVTLPEGEWRAGDILIGLVDYRVKSLAYGQTDLKNELLKIGGPTIAELRIVVTTPDKPLVRVRGSIAGVDRAMLSSGSVNVRLLSVGFAEPQTARVSDTGAFEFVDLIPGNYEAQLTSPAMTGPSTLFVAGPEPVKDVRITVPRSREMATRTIVDGGGPIPRLFLEFGFEASSVSIPVNSSADGSAKIAVPEGDIRLSFVHRPEGYTVKSVMQGNVDLQQELLKTSGEIRITLEKNSAQRRVSVSGRVVGLPPEAGDIQVTLEGNFTLPRKTTVKADGTFTFDQVFDGQHAITVTDRSGRNLAPQKLFDVYEKDVSGMEIVLTP